MNLLSVQSPYYSSYQSQSLSSLWRRQQNQPIGGNRSGPVSVLPSLFNQKAEETQKNGVSDERRDELRSLIRDLQQTQNQTNAGGILSQDQTDSFLEKYGAEKEEDEEQLKIKYSYNYRQVASQIRQAKTSASAGQALMAAKRKLVEVRRKLTSGDGDAEELQLALTHAKRMEMAARKKKHHLELEELVLRTQKRDEKEDQMDQAASELQSSLAQIQEDEVSQKEDAVFDKRQEVLEEMMDSLAESGQELSDESMAQFNELVSQMGEDELKELEESMELLESLELVDPHMSREELQDLKQKHRNAEAKALVKADMDYLKGMIKLMVERGGGIAGCMGSSSSQPMPVFAGSFTEAGPGLSTGMSTAMPTIDISI